jgi:hypothetical protein
VARAGTDDLQPGGAVHQRERADQLVDPLLPLQPAHEQHRGLGRGFGFDVAGPEPAQVDAAGHRATREPRAGAEELDGPGRGRGDHIGGPVHAGQIPPGPPRDPVGEHIRHPGVLQHVLRHDVVRGDGQAAGRGRGREQTAPDLEVRLHVHDVRAYRPQRPLRPRGGRAGQTGAEPILARDAAGAQPVHRRHAVPLDRGRGRTGVGRRHDVHLVPPPGEAGGKSRGEPGGTVDVGRVGVGADQDAQRTGHGRSRGHGHSWDGRGEVPHHDLDPG